MNEFIAMNKAKESAKHGKHLEARTDIEIIDFYRPTGNGKNLFVTNISVCLEEDVAYSVIQTALNQAFSRFGPIYEIQVFSIQSRHGIMKGEEEFPENSNQQTKKCSGQASTTKLSHSSSDPGPSLVQEDAVTAINKFYAFVKFYSAMCAKRAKSHLNMTSIIGKKPVKVSFASRKKSEKQEKLFFSSCYELANFYLGFNGWTSSIVVMKRDDAGEPQRNEASCRFLCIVELTIINHGLVTQGVGTVEESWDAADPASKANAIARCRKRSHQHALQNAFSKCLIVSLGNGKVHVEIDTTQADPLHRLESLQNLHLITVNELEEEPLESSGDEDGDRNGSSNVDDENVNILMELEAETEMCG